MNKRLLSVAVWFFLGLAVKAAAVGAPATQPAAGDSPERVVVFEVTGPWMLSGWCDINNNVDRFSTLELKDNTPHFTVSEVHSLRVWLHYLALPISLERYPVMVLRYRAVRSGGSWYNIWLDGGAGPSGGGPAGGVICAVGTNELVGDGAVHEVRMNLREKGLTTPTLMGIANGVATGNEPDGSYDLIGLRFEALPDAKPEPLGDDAAREVEVIDEEQQPIAGARVIVDAERRNFARKAETDEAGLAKVTPLMNESGKHMMRVEADGFVPVEQKDIGQVERLRVVLKRRQVLGGVVRTAKGEPLAGAMVRVTMPLTREAQDQTLPVAERLFQVPTDKEGHWRVEGVPASAEQFTLFVAHPDYQARTEQLQKFTPDMAKYRQGKGELQLQPAVSVVGTVFNRENKPVAGVLVSCGRGQPRAVTGKDGQFTLRGAVPGSQLNVAIVIGGKEVSKTGVAVTNEPEALTITID